MLILQIIFHLQKSFDFEFSKDQVVNVFEVKPQLETNYKVATGNNNQRGFQGGQERNKRMMEPYDK